MNEFLKLSWRIKHPSEIPQQLYFLSEEAASDSYVYKSFSKPLSKYKRKVKLQKLKEKYVAGKKIYRIIKKRSLLTKQQKINCLAALKLIQSGKNAEQMTSKDKYSLQIYQECQSKIVEENRNFLEHVQKIWNQNQNRPLKIRPGLLNFSWSHWKRKIERYKDYPQFYEEKCLISLNYDENDGTVEYLNTSTPLEVGILARFAPPTLNEPCILKIVTLPSNDQLKFNSKLPVSQDENIVKLLNSHQFEAVISSSGLKQLLDYTNSKSKWLLPVVIKEINHGHDNKDKTKIIFIDKPLPNPNPNYHDLKNYAYKNLLKTNFCQYKGFDHIIEETVRVDDEAEKEVTRKKYQIHHNASYRIWNIKKRSTQNTLMKNKSQDKEINLLVRCKLDACEASEQGVLYPVIIKPKIELQLQYGANIASKSELAREWTSLFFRIYSNLYRARIHAPLGEVVAVEKYTIQKINAEAFRHYEYKPALGLGVLQKILEHLSELECGNYLLQHLPKHENFLAVLKTTNNESGYNLHSEMENNRIDKESRQVWLPIDVNYILPAHEQFFQIPATFHGFDRINRPQDMKFKKKKGGKKKKKTENYESKTD